MLEVWLPGVHGDGFVAPLRAALPPDVVLHLGDATPEALAAVPVLVQGVPTEASIALLPALKHVIIPWAGVHPTIAPLLAARPEVTVHNLHHNAAPTAEMALTLLLAAWKHLLPMDRALRAGDWRERYLPPRARTVEGRRVTVLGYGAIGRRVAISLRAMGAEVTGIRRRASEAEHPAEAEGPAERVVGVDALDQVLPSSEALVVALPATPETEGLLDRRRLGLLPRGAVLVNVARGRVIDEEALDRALAEGHVGAAGLDVWWRYPKTTSARSATPPGTTRLHARDNVVCSPHRAGMTRENDIARAEAVAHLVGQVARGEPLDHRVDLERGY